MSLPVTGPPLRPGRSSLIAGLCFKVLPLSAVWGIGAFVITKAAVRQPTQNSVAIGLAVMLALAVGFGVLYVRILRLCSLSVSAAGMVEQRPEYQVSGVWEDVVSVQRRTWLGGLLRSETLLLRRTTAEPVDGQGKRRPAVPPNSFDDKEHNRIQLSLFDGAWREGPVGAALSSKGIPLGCACLRHGWTEMGPTGWSVPDENASACRRSRRSPS